MSHAADADRYLVKQSSIRLACKKCGSSGLIPLPQLSRLLFCNQCLVCYRVERAGLVEVLPPQEESIRVAVRTNSSQWREHRAVIRERPGFNTRLRTAAVDFLSMGWGRWVVAVCLTVTVAGVCLSGAAAPASVGPTPMPTSLAERAALWTTALARRDLATLVALTEPSQHRALRIWLAHGTGLPTVPEGSADPDATIVKVASTAGEPARAKVRAQLSTPNSTPVKIEEDWAENNGAWYFQPPRLRSVLPPAK